MSQKKAKGFKRKQARCRSGSALPPPLVSGT
jgi:hypothetical protein